MTTTTVNPTTTTDTATTGTGTTGTGTASTASRADRWGTPATAQPPQGSVPRPRGRDRNVLSALGRGLGRGITTTTAALVALCLAGSELAGAPAGFRTDATPAAGPADVSDARVAPVALARAEPSAMSCPGHPASRTGSDRGDSGRGAALSTVGFEIDVVVDHSSPQRRRSGTRDGERGAPLVIGCGQDGRIVVLACPEGTGQDRTHADRRRLTDRGRTDRDSTGRDSSSRDSGARGGSSRGGGLDLDELIDRAVEQARRQSSNSTSGSDLDDAIDDAIEGAIDDAINGRLNEVSDRSRPRTDRSSRGGLDRLTPADARDPRDPRDLREAIEAARDDRARGERGGGWLDVAGPLGHVRVGAAPDTLTWTATTAALHPSPAQPREPDPDPAMGGFLGERDRPGLGSRTRRGDEADTGRGGAGVCRWLGQR